MAPYKGCDIIHIYIHGLCVLLTAVSVPHHFMSMYIKFQSGHTQFLKLILTFAFFLMVSVLHKFRTKEVSTVNGWVVVERS